MLIERFKKQGLEQGKKEGIKEGIKKGKKEGKKEGIEETKLLFVKNLLSNTNFSVPKIAALADVTEAFVQKVKKTLK